MNVFHLQRQIHSNETQQSSILSQYESYSYLLHSYLCSLFSPFFSALCVFSIFVFVSFMWKNKANEHERCWLIYFLPSGRAPIKTLRWTCCWETSDRRLLSHNTAGTAFSVRHSLSISGPIHVRFHRAEKPQLLMSQTESFRKLKQGQEFWVKIKMLHLQLIELNHCHWVKFRSGSQFRSKWLLTTISML